MISYGVCSQRQITIFIYYIIYLLNINSQFTKFSGLLRTKKGKCWEGDIGAGRRGEVGVEVVVEVGGKSEL